MSGAKPKRWRTLEAKPGQLLAQYGRPDRHNLPNVCYSAGGLGSVKPDANLLMHALEEVPVHGGKSLREELTSRGYDITTMRFLIELASPLPGAGLGLAKDGD